MTKKPMDQNPLRTKVETQLVHTPLIEASTLSTDELRQELHVHQIELEMQNEELRRTHIALEESRDRYVNLYEFAPVGYLTLTREGLITEINLTGATLLGMERNKLINRRFAALVTPQDSDRWHRLFRRVIQHEGKVHDFELILQRSNNVVFHALLNCLLVATDDKAPVIRITLTDITKHKKTVEALHKSQKEEEALYKSKMDLNYAQAVAHIGSWRIDVHNNILEWSDENFRIFGIPKGTPLTYQSFLDIVHPADRQLVDTAWKDALIGKPFDIEHRIIVGQKVKWVRELAELEFGEHGSLLGGFGTTEDITDIKSTQEALQHERAFLRQVIDAVPSMIFVKNREGQFLLGNAALAQCYGTSPESLTGLTDENFNSNADEVAYFYQDGLDVINSGTSKLIPEEKLTHADGSVHWYSTIKIPLIDDDNRCNKLLSVATDITARKQIEEQLRWTEESFRLMVESVTDYAIVMLDPEGRVVSWNSGAQRIKGYSAEEIVGQHFSRFYPQEDIDSGMPQRDLDVVTAKGRFEDEGWRVRKNGSTFWANVVYTAIRDQDGNLRGYAKLTRDLTERKRLDQVLQENNAELENAKSVAEKANLAKSDFLSSMSHELRTPLSAILGFAQLLEAGSPPPTDTQKLRLHQIIKAGWYLLELINEILDLAVIESGRLSLSREPVSLIDVMLECQAMIEPQAQQRDIKLTFFPFDNTWFASADWTRVKQVLINLLSNAIKYNREHGTVEVKCTESTPERLRISVKDSGAGLAPEKLAQLFQPFNRLGRESSGEEGTGIGLVVTKQLVELMGGTIGVESTVGVGSEFWIELIRDVTSQFAAGNTLPAEPTPQAQGNVALRTLLYVEDNPANLMLVEQIIESHPHVRMLSAGNGNLGIALARIHIPDVILMDINLPGISGIQALKILREDSATAHIPVLALSANAMPRDIEKGLKAGFFRYLTKPIKVNEFMDALDGALKFSETGLDDTNNKDKYDD